MSASLTTRDISVYLIEDIYISSYANFIEEGLQVLHSKTKDLLSFHALLESCTKGSTSFFLVQDRTTHENVGFFCVSVYIDKGDVELHISAAYAVKNLRAPILAKGLQIVEEFGIMVQAKKITFSSPRRGSLKFGEYLGFDLISNSGGNYHYSKRV